MAAATSALVLRDFVNSFEPQTAEERWGEPDALHGWLVGHGLVTSEQRLTDVELEHVRQIREGLRQTLRQHAGHDGEGPAIRRMNELIALHAPRIRIEASGISLHVDASRAIDHVVAGVAAAVQACEADGSWMRLKACDRETCQWAYLDESRNRSRRWCSMNGCGNVLKMRRRSERAHV
ncbi:CGNR zinc finger domain-containing protein [Microbacterium phyllosphaerae]|uniref:CGNR zinc finger domain-containing protein n=1 Tax=Microbacterium phyllosphaerae TaxID=124798 RepID=UPI003D65CF57